MSIKVCVFGYRAKILSFTSPCCVVEGNPGLIRQANSGKTAVFLIWNPGSGRRANPGPRSQGPGPRTWDLGPGVLGPGSQVLGPRARSQVGRPMDQHACLGRPRWHTNLAGLSLFLIRKHGGPWFSGTLVIGDPQEDVEKSKDLC